MIKKNRNSLLCFIILGLGLCTVSMSVRADESNVNLKENSLNRLSTQTISLAAADTLLPANYPERFNVIGAAYEINRAKGFIDVSAHHYPLSPTARYYKLNSAINNLDDIKKGSIVGLIIDARNRVSAIYEVPSSMYQPG